MKNASRPVLSMRSATSSACFALLWLVSLWWVACGAETPEHAEIIEPVYGDPCGYMDCSDHGTCIGGDDGAPLCLCEPGYARDVCQVCEAGFHLDFHGRCAPDRLCAELDSNPCGTAGSCDDREGVIACHCDPGYEGPRCTLCARGYGKNEFGDCLQLVIGDIACDVDTCGGHGLCDDSAGIVSCDCDVGYEGSRCNACAPGYGRDGMDRCVPLQTCSEGICGEHGTCDHASGEVACTCAPGYAGPRCQSCAAGYTEMGGVCVPGATCEPDSCPETATCEDTTGRVVCTCMAGYTGEDCESCSLGYYRDLARGVCAPLDCQSNPGPKAGRVDFDELSGFPTFENNCVAGVDVNSKDVEFTSIGGDGTVWACALNSIYAIESDHVFVEAGQEGPAEIIFSGPVGQLTFRYGARSALNLELSADGVTIDTLNAGRRTNGTLIYVFATPITLFSFRSVNGTTNQLALDEVTYAPADCE